MRIGLLVIKCFKFEPENRFTCKQNDGEAGTPPRSSPSEYRFARKQKRWEPGASLGTGVDSEGDDLGS